MILNNKVALITGASRGIGASVAKAFAREGAHVILVARSIKGLEAIDDNIKALGGSATLVPMDLMHYDLIDQCASAIYQKFGKLDILVGNAGLLGGLGPLSHFAQDVINNVFATNVMANIHLIRAFDGMLRQGPYGRAIFVTSGIAKVPRPYWGLYGASKAALESLVLTYAAEVQNTVSHMRVNMVNPGKIRTKMRQEAMPGEDPLSLLHPDEIAKVFLDLARENCLHHGKIIQALS